MRIGEVEQQTGLPRKTIRFYESKGLLSVERSENSYRNGKAAENHSDIPQSRHIHRRHSAVVRQRYKHGGNAEKTPARAEGQC